MNSVKRNKLKTILIAVALVLAFAIVLAVVIELWYLPSYLINQTPFDISNEDVADGEIKAMSINVRCFSPTDFFKKSWFFRADLVMQQIEQEAPDVICFQEVTWMHYAYLTRNLVGYDSVNEYRDNSFFSEGGPIFYRSDKYDYVSGGVFWLSETPESMSIYENAACYRICTYAVLEEKATDKQLVAMCTHLDHVSDEARVYGMGVIIDKVESLGISSLPYFIMGDFNDYESSVMYSDAMTKFDDAKYLAQSVTPSLSQYTYQGWGERAGESAIDYCMLSKGDWQVDSYKVLTATFDGVYASDHFPIVLNMRLL